MSYFLACSKDMMLSDIIKGFLKTRRMQSKDPPFIHPPMLEHSHSCILHTGSHSEHTIFMFHFFLTQNLCSYITFMIF